MAKKLAAILGSGNIGADLCIKAQNSDVLEPALLVGIDAASEGLARAKERGVEGTARGIEGLLAHPRFDDIAVVFDATSAKAHLAHAEILRARGKSVVDLTPAAVGPYVVPVANLEEHLAAKNVNLVTCGGQATIPIVWAISRVAKVRYAEIVASISSRSAGPGTRANIDEFTETTARGLEKVGGAEEGKAIIVLNPAEPPLLMRDTVYALAEGGSDEELTRSVLAVVAAVQAYVPGYRLKAAPVFEELPGGGVFMPGRGFVTGRKVTVLLEVEGAGDWLPRYAGNLDIMTSAALAVGERMAARQEAVRA
jgi:acetaldehyde dehydrogenase